MSFQVSDIRNCHPKNGCTYLFDANVWLSVLYDFYNSPHYLPYTRFFNEIIRNITAPTARIGVPSLLLSELINRAMNDIHYHEYCFSVSPKNKKQTKHNHYKNNYRKSAHYIADLEDVCSNIRDYYQKIAFISDELNLYTCNTLIKKIPAHLDINDYMYATIARSQNLIIVTNDADFMIEDVQVLTTRPSLLNLMRV